MGKNPRNYPDTMPCPETGRPMTRGKKRASFKVEGKTFAYLQPGWWCSLDDPDDMEGQLVDEDNQAAVITAQQAAALLNVSHSYLVSMIDKGVLPAQIVDDQRLLPLQAVLAYKADNRAKRRAALAELAAHDQALGLE